MVSSSGDEPWSDVEPDKKVKGMKGSLGLGLSMVGDERERANPKPSKRSVRFSCVLGRHFEISKVPTGLGYIRIIV